MVVREARPGQVGRFLVHNSIVTRCYSYMFTVVCNSFFNMHLLDADKINVVLGRGREDVVNFGAGSAGLVRSIGGVNGHRLDVGDGMQCVEESVLKEIMNHENRG